LGQDFVSAPKLAATFPWAALTAAEYWKDRNINRAADRDDVKAVTRAINGGYNGLADREQYLAKAKKALKNADQPQETIDVAAAQKRLAELSYPLGSIDGKIGPLTRSAIRDFQDASGFPVTGALDKPTYLKLMSPEAPFRPVSEERAALTRDDLKNAGSKIIESTESIKNTATTAAGALAAASGMASQVKETADQVSSFSDWLAKDWQLIVIGLLLVIVAFCIYHIWSQTNRVEEERVNQARSGENVRV